jgi:OOP family OmpA-OmpF porin
MRAGWIAAGAVLVGAGLASSAATAHAEPRLAEPRLAASGFVGVGSFGDSELGNSWAPEQVPGTAAVVGARVGWLAVPRLVQRGRLHLSLAVEAELELATASTGEAMENGSARRSYFAPVFGWRAHALLRQVFGRSRLGVHLVLGAGGATVASSSPFMEKETDPVGYLGAGFTFALTRRWQIRFDHRRGLMPGRTSAATQVQELQLGLYATFGPATRRGPAPAPGDGPGVVARPGTPAPGTPAPGTTAPGADPDTDGDGLPDRLDRCPRERETVNGVEDGDGCPEPDPDGDGVIGEADRCPQVAEDADGFEDGDGCPDPDNDGDGIADATDKCRDEAEVKNGYADSDGCPDTVPDAVVRVLANGGVVRFEPGRARVSTAAKRALRPVLSLLEAEPDLAIVITGVPERAGGEDLAKRRAEAVKWYLVDQGLAEDRIEAAVGSAPGKAPIAMSLRTAPITSR